MKTIKLCCLFLFTCISTFAQVGIGTIAPEPSAILELKATDKALLLTRIAGSAAIAATENGMIVYDTTLNCFRSYENGVWTPCWNCCAAVSTASGTLTALNCTAVTNGTLTHNVLANGVSSEYSYTGGNGGIFLGQAISSTGVTGLTATLVGGNFASGSGSVTYVISGTPSIAGTANFAINLAGQNCVLTMAVN
jgi:hypothetical protein